MPASGFQSTLNVSPGVLAAETYGAQFQPKGGRQAAALRRPGTNKTAAKGS
jgi:hypothetical protein